MATAGDGMAPSESGGAGEKLRKTPVRTENPAPARRSSDEGGNSGIPELEQMLKQVTVTRFNLKNPATMEDLPDELLINILIRLLARQLAQMRSVSKSWNSLLSDPSFVKSHLHRSIRNNNHQLLLLFPNYHHKRVTQYSCKSPHLEPTNFITHIPPNLPECSTVIGAVNGLICLSEDTYANIRIWNPSLSAVSAAPPSHYLILSYYQKIRFGYDPKTDDYKLVKISGIHNNYNYFSVKEWLKVEVYSMRKGSWKFITQPFPSHIKQILNMDYLCVDGHDGHLHWENRTGPLREHTILAFDLGSETFSEIPLPDSILDSNHGRHQLGVLDGKLCEMSWHMDGGWEVWVMEEYGMPESWVRSHVLSQFKSHWRYPCGFTSRNELLFKDKDNRLGLYDPIANKTKVARIEQKVVRVVEYVDSLVWS